MNKTAVHVVSCSQCGAKASEGENREHARLLAKAEGFQFRSGVRGAETVLCSDCGSVKALNTTSAQYLSEQGVKKI